MNSNRTRSRITAVLGMFGLAIATLLGASPASAEPPYATEGVLTSASFVTNPVESGEEAQITVTWAIADNPEPPAGFVAALDPALNGHTDSFPLIDADGVTVGQCTVEPTQVFCDLDNDYIAANPRGLSGSMSFWATVTTVVDEETEVTYDIGDQQATTTVTPVPDDCTENCDFTGRSNFKWGEYNGDLTISWGVVIKAGPGGMVGGEEVTVVDRIGPNQEIVAAWLVRTNQVGSTASGTRPINFRPVQTSDYTLSSDLTTVSFLAAAGYFYEVRYTSTVTDGGASVDYPNEADITIGSTTTVSVSKVVTIKRGSGTGSGTNVGTFSVTKEVIGNGAAAAAGMVYAGQYLATAPDGAIMMGKFEIAAGETFTSDELPRGSVINLSEVAPVGPAGVSWAAPVWSENDFTLGSGTHAAVTLTNEATVTVGTFSVAKAIEGDGAAQVPADATFVVEYSYPAGEGFEAGAGELIVPADGTVVQSPTLPGGAQVTLTEVTPGAIAGLSWGAPVFSTDTFTIGAAQVHAVQLTNTVTVVPPPPTTPPPPTPPGRTPPTPAVGSVMVLAETGADTGLGGPLAALAMLITGAAMLTQRRRALR